MTFSKSYQELSLLHEITKDVVKDQVKQDDFAVSAYVNQICDNLKLAGEDITNYCLVRTTDMNIGGSTIQYSIVKKERIKDERD